MVHSCCVVGCSNRQNKEKHISLHRFPKYPLWRRESWTCAIKRLQPGNSTPGKQKTWQPTDSSRVCSEHFITGKPVEEPDHPDFIPNQNLTGKAELGQMKKNKVERFQRSKNRRKAVSETPTQSDPCEMEIAASALLDLSNQEPNSIGTGVQCELLTDRPTSMVTSLQKALKEKETINERLQKKCNFQAHEINRLKLSFLNMDNNMMTFYTGLTIPLFLWIYEQIFTQVESQKQNRSFSLHDHLLLILVKIRLGLLNKDLSFRFDISETCVSRIWNVWIPIVAKCLKPLIRWAERDVARTNIPLSFKPNYKKCVSIIDCFEIFIERPRNLTARAQTWSNYKHNNTIKYLISITPSGAINFLSAGWGGMVSDKEIALKSGYLDKLLPGDEVVANKWFLVSEEMASRGVVLRIPSFTRGKEQLSEKDVETSRKLSELAHVLIHVERVIGRMRNFHILETNIAVCQVNLLNDIIIIIGALHNLLPPIVEC